MFMAGQWTTLTPVLVQNNDVVPDHMNLFSSEDALEQVSGFFIFSIMTYYRPTNTASTELMGKTCSQGS